MDIISQIEVDGEEISEKVIDYSADELAFWYGASGNSYNGEVIPIGTKKLILSDGGRRRDNVTDNVDVGLDKLVEVKPILINDGNERVDVYSKDISLVRGLVKACGFDLSKFTTDKILEKAPEKALIEVRVQDPQKRFTNIVNSKENWKSVANYEKKHLKEYAKYQKKCLKKEMDSKSWEADGYCCKGKVKFGTNVDLQDAERWKEQLAELEKLPYWAKLDSKEHNLLSHLGYTVMGVNSLQAYLKVRGCRTPAHQENLNFCSVNINIGPYETEWFAVGYEDWRKVDELCNRKDISFPRDAWWPEMLELQRNGIRVYRVTQKPGDLVFVNCGCIHWVQATGTCNNIAYNVGPLRPEQYEASVVRYEANRVHSYKSIVPMKFLTWKFADEYTGNLDERLRKLMLYTMAVSIVEIKKLYKYCHEKKVDPILPEDPFFTALGVKNLLDILRFCVDCKCELFHLFFIKVGRKKRAKALVIHCLKCALHDDPDMSEHRFFEQGEYEKLLLQYNQFRRPIIERDANSADR